MQDVIDANYVFFKSEEYGYPRPDFQLTQKENMIIIILVTLLLVNCFQDIKKMMSFVTCSKEATVNFEQSIQCNV